MSADPKCIDLARYLLADPEAKRNFTELEVTELGEFLQDAANDWIAAYFDEED